MLTKLHYWWQEKRSSFWFVPAVMVLDAVVLAIVLITVGATIDLHVVERWSLLFGAGAAGPRGLLTAVAGSMITVAGMVFSITLIALSLTSSQYTSRVVRNFMRGRVTQVVLGALQTIARQTANPSRRRSVHEKAQWIADPAEHNIESPYDREMFENRLVRVREALETSRCYHKQKNQ